MDSFNKIVSFVLGLVVVIVFLAVITGRFNLRNGIKGITSKPKTTVTPTPSLTGTVGRYLSPTPLKSIARNTNTTNNYGVTINPPKSIPATGSPTLLLPLLFSSLSLGMFLKKKK